MKKQIILILIITVVCGLIAGTIAFYQQQKTNQTISVDIISTIVPTEQEKPSGILIDVDSLQYNQTLAAILNVRANGRSPLQKNNYFSTSWDADLNSAVLHAQTQINDQKKANVVPVELINTVQETANSLNAKHYDNKILSKISLLSSSSPSFSSSPNSPQSPYLITFLGLLVGYFISLILLKPITKN